MSETTLTVEPWVYRKTADNEWQYQAYSGDWLDVPSVPHHKTLDALATAERELDAIRKFARKVIFPALHDGLDIDGGDVQDWAVGAGLLAPHEVTEACDPDACRCAEWGFPSTCYRPTPLLLGHALPGDTAQEGR